MSTNSPGGANNWNNWTPDPSPPPGLTPITIEQVQRNIRDRAAVICQLGTSGMNGIYWLPACQYTARIGLTPQGLTNSFGLEERPDFPMYIVSHDLFIDPAGPYPTFYERATGHYVRLLQILG